MLTIISGGQTGVDRAALDVAIELEFEHGGWCPQGRRAEDGPLDEKYQLNETDSSDYRLRTEYNVRDSDGTLILCFGKLTGGTLLTKVFSENHKKPLLVADLDSHPDLNNVLVWLRNNHIQILNVAGPRESKYQGAYERAHAFLDLLLRKPGSNNSLDE